MYTGYIGLWSGMQISPASPGKVTTTWLPPGLRTSNPCPRATVITSLILQSRGLFRILVRVFSAVRMMT